MEKPCYLFDKSVYMDYYELVCPCETTGKRRRKMLPISVARLLNFACHLFCQLFVWSMNTMILILPQCVSYDLFTTNSRLAERDFGKKPRLRSQEVWEMFGVQLVKKQALNHTSSHFRFKLHNLKQFIHPKAKYLIYDEKMLKDFVCYSK